MSQPLLAFANVTCERGGRLLFEQFNLTLNAGECVEIHGANGSGKSTLLRAAAGLFIDYSGAIDAAPFHYVGHKHGLSALLSAKENLLVHERLAQGSRRCSTGAVAEGAWRLGCDSVTQALRRMGLGGAADMPCGQLSEGQRRRVALARLLLGRRPLWLLDEPLTALDAEGRSLVRGLLIAHCEAGGAALCATHQGLGCPGAKEVRLGAAVRASGRTQAGS